MAGTSQERQALAERINRLVFAEYRRAGWFKAATLPGLRGYVGNGAGEVVERYARAPADPSLDRDLIRLFLGEWLVCHHPESVGAFGLDPAEFRPIGRAEALAVADRVVAASLDDPRARIEEWPESASRPAEVPYPQLQAWFAELFGKGCRFYLHDSPGGRTVRFDLANPRVIGLAPDVIGMLWLE